MVSKIIRVMLTSLAILLVYINNIATAQSILPLRSLTIDNSTAGATNVKYSIGFSSPNQAELIGSVKITFCENSTFIDTPCDLIDGFSVQNSLLSSQSGPNDFSILPSPSVNSVIFSRTSSPIGSVPLVLNLSGVNNPSNKGTFFGRIQTFSSQDASGTTISSGGVTFAITSAVSLNTVVPPYLYLCVGISVPGIECKGSVGNFIDMGELSRNITSTGTSQFIVATNAKSGFNVAVRGSPPSAGSNVISALTERQYSQLGVSQFGINLRQNSVPNVGSDPIGAGSGVISQDYDNTNQFKFKSGDYIVYSNSSSLGRKFTVSYIINVSPNQRPGTYSATYLYTAVAML